MSVTQQDKLPLLRRRAIVPDIALLDFLKKDKQARGPLSRSHWVGADDKVNIDNVQGDVYPTFPRRWERFLFFKIVDVSQFKKDLYKFSDRITSCRQTMKDLLEIEEKRGQGQPSDIVSHAIAFSRAGLRTININDRLRDIHFDQGSMVNEKKELGDQACYNRLFKTADTSHGVIWVTTKLKDSCKARMDEVRQLFKNSIEVLANWEGRVRSGEAEHFGWRDGISQPALAGIAAPVIKGQREVNPGAVILGYKGDPVYDDRTALARPTFTKDGSFMVFRKLEQNVLYLEDYISQNWRTIDQVINNIQLTEAQRKALFGARMFGRFKSGVPLALSPIIENPEYTKPEYINNFDYTERANGCPFSAHIRKTEPRNLQPIVRKEYLDASVIVRSGIPYGPEISAEELEIWSKLSDNERYFAKCNRGLLFVCYQSSLDNGFYRQTTGFANNDFFPITGLVPQMIGQDPIIGGPQSTFEATVTGSMGEPSPQGTQTRLKVLNQGQNVVVNGVAKKQEPDRYEQKFFATSRGGEYYFVPSISTVKSWGTAS